MELLIFIFTNGLKNNIIMLLLVFQTVEPDLHVVLNIIEIKNNYGNFR